MNSICIQDACMSIDMQMLSSIWIEIIFLTCVKPPMGLMLKSG